MHSSVILIDILSANKYFCKINQKTAMPDIRERIQSLTALGAWLRARLDEITESPESELNQVIDRAGYENGWFTRTSVLQSLQAVSTWLEEEALNNWTKRYFLSEPVQVKRVAVIMAGNIPLVNFHDFLAVLITGHRFLGKLSSQDKVLLPFIANKLIELNAGWKDHIEFTEERLDSFDAVIATGSNNTSRYFEFYFGKYPHIIRKNRQSIAVLTGDETFEEVKALYQDIFQYYGMGCRNVSMLLVPEGYHFPTLFDQWEGLEHPTDQNKYQNNYDYHRSIYLVNREPFFDTGYVSVLRNESPASPVSVLHYKEYTGMAEVIEFIKVHEKELQCIVAKTGIEGIETVLPGQAQCPALIDYPDGVDIIQFLLAL
jgi:hypothetical protein